MTLFSFFTDTDCSVSELNSQATRSEELSSQQTLAIIQRDHFNRLFVLEPENFGFVDVGVHNLSVRQHEGFSTDPFETQTTNDVWRKTQITRETGIDDNGNLALRGEGLQDNNWLARSGYFSVDGHE